MSLDWYNKNLVNTHVYWARKRIHLSEFSFAKTSDKTYFWHKTKQIEIEIH